MRLVIQRVDSAAVFINHKMAGSIQQGILIFIGIMQDDNKDDLDFLIKKTIGLRIFNDNIGKMNLSIKDINGEALVVSQFTLCADITNGNRPSFIKSKNPAEAKIFYNQFCSNLKNEGIRVSRGVFGAHMNIKIENNGPVTIILDSKINYD